jgi:cytochrome o ubiquinol oxidase subunit 2
VPRTRDPRRKRSLRSIRWLALLVAAGGCGLAQAPILDPAGPVTEAGRDILIRAFAIMMVVVIPAFALTFWVIWRYRASHPRSAYDRDWSSDRADAVTWIVPAAIVASLGVHVWIYTHRLDPYRPLDAGTPPLEVEVVAQDWKWLFLYPEQGVAAVNEIAFPSSRPIRLRITSDTVMNAFFIPALGSQIYAMAGMQTQLNLAAHAPGRFVGRNTQYSGAGFPEQQFAALAMTDADFDAWVARARASAKRLDAATYAELARPSTAHPVTYYAAFAPDLFATIVASYTGHGGHGQ